MPMWMWRLLGVREDSPASRRKLGVIALVLILALTTLSATQDVAIDSYSVGLVERAEEGAANGVRASVYRVAVVFVGGG